MAALSVLVLGIGACSGDGAGGDGTVAGPGAGSRGDMGDAKALASQGPTGPSAPVAGITVQGSGRVSGTPDTLTATVGVEVERPTVQEALDAGNAGAQRVIDAVLAAGVAEEDVQTVRYDVHPRHAQEPGRSEPEIRGYLVSNLLEVRIREVDRAGEVLAAVTEAGGQDARVQGIRFSLEDNEQLVDQARDRAFADARRRAEDYAQLADRALGPLVSIDETSTPQVPVETFAADAAAEDGGRSSVPVRPGQQEIEVRVTTVWSLS